MRGLDTLLLVGANLPVSIPLLALLASQACRRAFRVDLLRPADITAAAVFATVAGIALYPSALGLGPFDAYALGWGFSPLLVMTALTAVGLIWKQHRFGVVLGLAMLAYDVGFLESNNLWDYLIDPLLWIWSCVHGIRAVLARKASAEEGGDPSRNEPA